MSKASGLAGAVRKRVGKGAADAATAALVGSGVGSWAAALRSKKVRRAVRRAVALGLLFVMAVGALLAGASSAGDSLDVERSIDLGIPPPVMAAYQHSALLRCDPDTGNHFLADEPGEVVPSGWRTVDWRLVAAVGHIESGDVRGRTVDAYGGVWPPVVGPPLNGTIEGLKVIGDTDRGRYDGETRWDAAVGPMQFLPATVASYGIDGNADGVVDPQNLYDATVSAAFYLCMTDSNLRAYNDSQAYEEAVRSRLGEITSVFEGGEAWSFPVGLPMAWVPPFELQGADAVVDPPTRALAAAAARAARDGALGEPLADLDVLQVAASQPMDCGVWDRCVWETPVWAEELLDRWRGDPSLGLLSPVTNAGWAAVSDEVAGALTPHYRFPALAGGVVAWPLAVDPVPMTGRYDAPEWWAWHTSDDAAEWTAAGGSVVVDAPAGAWVGWPASGTASVSDGCGTVVDTSGWEWGICGLFETTPSVTVDAGDGAGRSDGSVTISLSDPQGTPKCPQALFAEWPQRALTPAVAEAEQEAREQEALEEAERDRREREQAAIEAAIDAGIDPATLPPVELEVPDIPDPLDDCHG